MIHTFAMSLLAESNPTNRDVSSPPAHITNTIGRIVLRSLATERLLLDNPLAFGFDILLGSMSVTVPDVPPGLYQAVGE
jgi:hypothetical protein